MFSPDIAQFIEPQSIPCIAARPFTTSAKRAALGGALGVGTTFLDLTVGETLVAGLTLEQMRMLITGLLANLFLK
jgi:hypothetical protein